MVAPDPSASQDLAAVPVQAQGDAAAYSLLDARTSWVVRDRGGRDVVRSEALRVLIAHSPLFFPLSVLLAPVLMRRIGTQSLKQPVGLAVDNCERIFVADQFDNTVYVFEPDSGLTTFSFSFSSP